MLEYLPVLAIVIHVLLIVYALRLKRLYTKETWDTFCKRGVYFDVYFDVFMIIGWTLLLLL